MITTVTPNTLLEYCIETSSDFIGGARLKEIPYTVGGKGINVARILKTFGVSASALTFVGGHNGQKIKQKLKEQQINAKFVETSSETRMGVSIIEDNGKKHRWWMEEGSEISESEINQMLLLLKEESKKSSILSFSGSIPGNSHPDLYLRMLKTIEGFNGEVYVDACGKPLLEACKAGGFFLKHNREEAILTFGKDPFEESERKSFFNMLSSYKIKGAMITDGAAPVILWDGTAIYTFEPAKTAVVSAVGCGDATLGGLIYSRLCGKSLIESAIVGLAAGAADAGHKGPCEAQLDEIKKLIGQVKMFTA